MNIRSRLASLAVITLLLAGCGSADIHGTYAKTDSALTIKFDSGKAFVTGLTSMDTEQGTYKLDGDKIILNSPGHFHLEFTRNKDGTLHLEHLGGTLVRTHSDS